MVATVCLSVIAQEKPIGGWIKMPLPVASNDVTPRVQFFSTDKGGTPWTIIYGALYYWDGKQYVKPVDSDVKQTGELSGFVGGNDRDLYVVQMSNDMQNGSLLKLANGTAKYITDCPTGHFYDSFPVYVSKDGKLYNWGGKFLAVYSSGYWKRIETTLNTFGTLVFESNNTIYFYYNGILCSADGEDNLITKDVTVPLKQPKDYELPKGAIWSKDCALLSSPSENGVVCLNLRKGEIIPHSDDIAHLLDGFLVAGMLSLPDGSVVISGRVTKTNEQLMYTLNPSGKIDTIQLDDYPADINTALQNQQVTFCNIEGSLWIGLPSGGILQIKDGTPILHDWRNGAPFGWVTAIRKGIGNTIYASSENYIYAYNSDSVYQPSSDWTEYSSSNSTLIRDANGHMWMFLVDHPGKISCWKNGKWNHYDLPAKSNDIECMFSDDRGHILVESIHDNRACYDFCLNGIRKFDSMEDALVAAVADGAKTFNSPRGRLGCILTKDGRIVFSRNNGEGLSIWDGKHWGRVALSQEDNAILESSKYGFLVRHGFDECKFLMYDRGQLVPIEFPGDSTRQFLVGCSGLQPYDEDLFKRNPNSYFVGERINADSIKIHAPGCPLNNEVILANYNSHFSIRGKGFRGGMWLNTSYAGKRFFYLGGKVIMCDFANTPLEFSSAFDIFMLDDCDGNLWVNVGSYLGKQHVYMRRAQGVKLRLSEPPDSTGHSVKLKLSRDSIIPKDSQLFWNVDDGEWNPYEVDSTRIAFNSNGKHQVKLITVDSIGCVIAASSPVTINSKGPYPETKLASKGPFTVKEMKWKLPVTGTSPIPGAKIGLMYRIDKTEWVVASDSGEAILTGISGGYHKIEVATLENGVVADPNPVQFDFTYAPDWEESAHRILMMFGDPDQNARNKALTELKTLGPGVVPELRRQLDLLRTTPPEISQVEDIINRIGK